MPLFRTLVAASGYACAAAVALWASSLVSSYSHRFQWGELPVHSLDLCVNHEAVVLAHREDDPYDTINSDRGDRHMVNAQVNEPHFYALGLGGHQRPGYQVFVLPLWMPIALTLVIPAWIAWNQRKKMQLESSSLCLKCRYDLRAHQEGQRCPECGTVIARSAWRAYPVELNPAIS